MASSSWAPEGAPNSVQDNLKEVPGFLESAVEEYATWHLSRVSTNSYKENIRKARDIASENCFDIAQICGKSPDFFVSQGVAISAARRFVGHTRLWLKEREDFEEMCAKSEFRRLPCNHIFHKPTMY